MLLPITILFYHYPIPALNKALYHRDDFVKASPRHRQDITVTMCVCRTPKGHQSSPIIKVHRQLLADVATINPRIFPDASPNIRRYIGDTSPKARQYIACEFSRGTTRSTSAPIATSTRIFHRQYIAKHFGPRGTVA